MKNTKFPLQHFFLLPNILSIIRVLLLPVMVYLLKIDTNTGNVILVILALVVIASDYFDGFFSRKLNQVTDLGKILDPLADKIAMTVILVALILYRQFPISLVIFLIYRDLMIIGFGLVIAKKDKILSSNQWGKWNTFIISIVCFLNIIRVDHVIFTLFYFAGYFTILASGISYYRVGERFFLKKRLSKYFTRIGVIVFFIFILKLLLGINLTPAPDYRSKETDFTGKIELLNKYAPVLYMTADEEYLPIDVNSFLDNAGLMEKSFFLPFDNKVKTLRGINQVMKSLKGDNYYLKINRPFLGNILKKYKPIRDNYDKIVYAQAFKIIEDGKEPIYILQYWFFFWVNKAGNFNIVWHECDWEVVMIWLDRELKPVKAGYSQHYYGEVRSWEMVPQESDHPLVYIARGSHAPYFEPGFHRAYYDNNRTLQWGKDYCSGDIKLIPDQYHLSVLKDDSPWLNFKGFWGIPIITKLDGPKGRNPKNKKLSMWQNPIGWFKKYQKLTTR